MYEKSVTYQFIVNVDTYDAGTPGTTTVEDFTAGQGGLVDGEGVLVSSTTTAGTRLRFAQRLSDGNLVYSPFFTLGTHLALEAEEYDAPTMHSVTVGESGNGGDGMIGQGTAGAIEAGETYTLSIVITSSQSAINNTPIIKTVPYRAQTNDTQLEVSRGLFDASLNIVNRNLPNRIIQVGRIFNPGSASDITTGAAQTVGVTYGSTNVTQTTHARSVGDAVDIDGDWYIITDTETNSFTIDRPYQGETDAAIAHADINFVPTASVGDGTWSLRFTALDRPFDPVTDMYNPVRFTITTSGFAPDLDISTTAADPGSGTYEQVAQQEIYSAMNEGKPWVQAYPPTKYRLEADPDNDYDILSVVYPATDSGGSIPVHTGTGQVPTATFRLIIASNATLTTNEHDNYETALDR